MIITKLQGGLGNQIFQWAYGKFLSEKYNTPLYLDANFYSHQYGVTFREFSLCKFPNLKYQLISEYSKLDRGVIQVSDNFIYKNINYNPDRNYYLNGYWQSEKYFVEIQDLIRSELKPSPEFFKKFNYLFGNNNISMHIRRTDYVTSNGYHPVQTIEYYNQAIEIIGDYDNILVFSDDIKWCKENLKFRDIIFIDGNDDIEDLWIMSTCKDNVIANSSFSWWGAWLNQNRNKKVICPKNWFGSQSNIDDRDIVPSTWIKI